MNLKRIYLALLTGGVLASVLPHHISLGQNVTGNVDGNNTNVGSSICRNGSGGGDSSGGGNCLHP